MYCFKLYLLLCTKFLLFLLQAYSQINEWEKSKHYFLKAAKLSPNNTEIRQELAQLDRLVNNNNKRLNEFC